MKQGSSRWEEEEREGGKRGEGGLNQSLSLASRLGNQVVRVEGFLFELSVSFTCAVCLRHSLLLSCFLSWDSRTDCLECLQRLGYVRTCVDPYPGLGLAEYVLSLKLIRFEQQTRRQ